MRLQRQEKSFRLRALAAAALITIAGVAQAQLSSSTIKGQISADSKPAQAGLVVTATNLANGNTHRTSTLANGSYVLTGLAPGRYEIRVASQAGVVKSEVITVQVGETASLDLGYGATNLQQVVVLGSSQRKDVRNSEVGTNVSRKMIESLPQTTHNFLSSADLAPGVAFVQDGAGNTKLQAGSQNHDNVNVFIDGVGQKNNILRGGLTGQDSSRGNPFPQSAIAEYKVLTQNYKAEFDQVSSAAISAVTKSGSNEFHGEVYYDRTGTNWRATSPFEKAREAAGVALPPSSKNEFGFSVGGPIKKDEVHFFFAYDGKNIDDSRQIVPQNLDKLPAGKGIVPTLLAAKGNQVDSFREHLLFGKLDVQIDDEQHLSASVRVRRETDRNAENRELSVPGNDKNKSNDETRLDLKHEWARNAWLSEMRLGYEDALWNPHSAADTPFLKYKVSTNSPQTLSNSQDVLFMGGSPDMQRRGQKGTFISEDLTYTGLAGHVLKGGAKLKAMSYNLSGTAFGVDTVEALIDTVTGQPYYNGGLCTGTNVVNNGLNSDQCKITKAIPGASAAFSNNQLGLYVQDDWALTRQLELNLGVRYDVESNMLNNSYATPADRVAALMGLDVERWGIKPAAGQTYAQSLAKGGVNISDYISTGSSRKAFKNGLAPRLGGSFDVLGDRATVVFGGWGRSYDRAMANHALDEMQKNSQPGGEIWLIKNNFKMPFSDQFTLGLRQGVGAWNAEIALSQIHAQNQFVWFSGNRDANGAWANQPYFDPMWGGPNGYGSLILGDFISENRTNSLFLKAEKPYTQASGWGVNLAYTYSDAKTKHREWDNDIFDWGVGRTRRDWNPSRLVDRHRIVAAGVADNLLPWGMTLSGKATWASGLPRRIVHCWNGWAREDGCPAVSEAPSPSFRQVDLGVAKQFKLGTGSISLRADLINAFNSINYNLPGNPWGGGKPAPGQPANSVGADNLDADKPESLRGPMRELRLTLTYNY